jgi:hypothetical protein
LNNDQILTYFIRSSEGEKWKHVSNLAINGSNIKTSALFELIGIDKKVERG